MKGISPLIAAVLLIAFTVAIGSIIFSWANTLTKESTSNIGTTTSTLIDCNVADVNIDDVYLDLAGNMSRVIIRNSGQTDGLQIVSAILVNIRGENASLNTSLPIKGFNRSEMRQLTFNVSGVITNCANFSKVIVAATCGKSDTWTSTPRGC